MYDPHVALIPGEWNKFNSAKDTPEISQNLSFLQVSGPSLSSSERVINEDSGITSVQVHTAFPGPRDDDQV